MDYQWIERQLSDCLQLNHRPVAVTFCNAEPPGVPRFRGTVPSSCSFWRLASNGQTFCTVPSDHYNCPIGAYTHHIDVPQERTGELDEALGFMTRIGYIRLEEVGGMPRVPTAPSCVVYAPLGDTPLDPDVVLFIDRPGRLMLLQETALRAGVVTGLSALARPTCTAIPASMMSGMVASVGCIGNRVYTDIGDEELFIAVAGKELPRLVDDVRTIAAANATLVEHHRERRRKLTVLPN